MRHLTHFIAENIKSEMRFTVINKGNPVLCTVNSHKLLNQRYSKYQHAYQKSKNGKDLESQLNAGASLWAPPSIICLPELSFNTKREVVAPPGKLGIIIKPSLYGFMIQSVKPESPMLGILFPEDLILSFNDMVSVANFTNTSKCSYSQQLFLMFMHRMSWSLIYTKYRS